MRWLFLSLLCCFLAAGARAADADEAARKLYGELREAVRLERIEAAYREISTFGSRIPGSSGERKTLEYAERELRRLGLTNFRREPFSVTVPDPKAFGEIQLGNERVRIYPLWPNLVRTSTCDVSGPVLYGGDGSLSSLSGKRIEGSIVVLEFNSGTNWKNAAKLGAVAVVFIEPEDSVRLESEQKFVSTPLAIPRFWLPLESAARVLRAAEDEEAARLACRQDWIESKTYNLLADLPGTDAALQHEPVLLTAYADAMCIVPALASGVEQSSGLVGLLEAIRILKERSHRRPVTVAVLAAHTLGLQGAREHVYGRLSGENSPLFLAVNVDLSSGSGTLGSFGRGWFNEARDESQEPMRATSRLLRQHSEIVAPVYGLSPARLALTDAVNNSDSRTWKNNIPGQFALDCEAFLAAQLNVLAFTTVDDARLRVDTPFDNLSNINLSNISRQVSLLSSFLYRLLNDTSSPTETSNYRVQLEPVRARRMSLVGGFGIVEGRVVIYDPEKSFVPDVPVEGSLAVAVGREKTFMGVRGHLIQHTGKDAKYRFLGLPTSSTYIPTNRGPSEIAAFKTDLATGDVVVGPTYGGAGDYNSFFQLRQAYKSTPIVVFPCVATDLYDLSDPQELKGITWLGIFDAKTNGDPTNFGVFRGRVDFTGTRQTEDTATVLTEPGQQYKILMSSAYGELRLILTNSSAQSVAGSGYKAPGEKATDRQVLFPFVPLTTAKDICAINESRLREFREHRIISEGVAGLHETAQAELRLAEQARSQLDWEAMERHARAAWGYALRAHPVIQGTTNDVVNGVVFYLFLLIPFSYFAERLLIASRVLTRQLAYTILIFVGAFVVLRIIHPAFEIVSNPLMIFISFVMGTLSMMVTAFILGKFENALKTVRAERIGLKEVDIQRMSVAMAAFNLGVNNMRRRKARTFLTTLTLVVMTFIVLSFTSIVPELQLRETPSDTPARYSGLMLRNPDLGPLQTYSYDVLQNEFAGVGHVSRRVYYYGADIGDSSVFTLRHAERTSEARAVLGLDAEESEITRPQDGLLPGGRWFLPGEGQVMILPRPLADSLGIDAAEVGKAKARFAGNLYTVIGIIDDGQLRAIQDLDGDGLLPADFTLSRQFQQEANTVTAAFRSYIRLDPSVVVIVPATTAVSLGGQARSVAVALPSGAATAGTLRELMPRLRMNLYAAVNGEEGLEVRQFSVIQGSKGVGVGLVIVQMLIAGVFVLNTMIASVYERTREISIFSAIGLAPNHIAMLFFAESSVYGVLGAVIGYFAAQVTAKIISATGAFPGLYLNFSSTSAVLSAGLVMGVVLLSTIYPARKASQIAAPALREEAAEGPETDEWRVALPFSVGAAEAGPIMAFFEEWFRAYEEYTIGNFVTSGTNASSAIGEQGAVYTIECEAWIAPYDLGVSQHLSLLARPTKIPQVYELELTITRRSGEHANWVNVNSAFLAAIRKQFLTWRAVKQEKDSKELPAPA